jgi:hypothetical protein
VSRLPEPEVSGGASGARGQRWLAALFGLAAFVFALATVSFTNDHFHRISSARQIAVYGEFPFRDFLDPGYFLTEFTSAALQRLLGDNLLGEWLLTSAFIAGGAVTVLLLARRLSDSWSIALAVATLALLSLPRTYDYDKVLFYPLGLLLCWRYIDDRRPRNLWILATGIVVSALFRYDTGVYLSCAAVTAIAIVHARDWRTAVNRVALFAAAVVCLALPYLVFLQFAGGAVNAVDQMMTYGRREAARTRIRAPLRFSFGKLAGMAPVDAASMPILIRWAPFVNETARHALEAEYELREGARSSEEDRTWSYRIEGPSVERLRALGNDSRVEDTRDVDRARLSLESETILGRAGRRIPVLRWRIFPGAWTFGNANAFLYHLLRWLPLVGAFALVLAVSRRAASSPNDSAHVSTVIVLCLVLNLFILRNPVYARVGGLAGPPAVLAAWLTGLAWRARPGLTGLVSKVAVVVVLGLTVWSLSLAMEWEDRLKPEMASVSHLSRLVTILSASPPSLLPNSDLRGMVTYLRECTGPDERVLAIGFLPDLYFFAQRGFVGSSVFFGGHWSESRFERRVIEGLASHASPVAIVETQRADDVAREYPGLEQYLGEHYVKAGETSFGSPGVDPDEYTLFTDKTRIPSHTHLASGMPCFD